MNAAAASQELHDLYRELILDHAKAPRNFGRLDSITHSAEGINPVCGDRLSVYLSVDSNNRIDSVSFEGSGCAISLASASLLTETVDNLSVTEAEACFRSITGRLSLNSNDESPPAPVNLEKLAALDGVRDHPARIKCATLAWHALHAALNQKPLATTE